MQYDGHKAFADVFTILAVPVAIGLGVFPKIVLQGDSVATLVNSLPAIVSAKVAFDAGRFGACFPDLDSKKSVPSQKYPLLAAIFQFFGVKHRGTFSHSFLSLTMIFLALFAFVTLGVPELVHKAMILQGISRETYDILNVLAFPSIVGIMQTAVFFSWVGAMSHLIADLITDEGVWLTPWGVRLRPAHFSILGWKPLKGKLLTNGKWGTAWEVIMRYSFIPAVAYTLHLLIWQTI